MNSIRRARRFALLLLLAAGTAAAGTVTGTVKNGTSGKPAAGVDVILIQLQGGMNSVGSTKTDAQGKYKLDNPGVGQGQPMLIRAVYRGVMFHQPLVPGNTTVDVTVYDPTNDPKTVTVGSRVIVFQPNTASLLVGEEYALQNGSQPPLAYFNEKGDFNFDVPQGAQLSQVSSWGPSKMPVVQGTINRGDSKYAIAYAFQPGDNGVRLSYDVPYPASQTTLHFDNGYAVQRVMLVAPPSVKIDSDGFMASGTEQGFNLYTRDGMPAGLPFEVSVSGTAPPPAPAAQAGDAQAQAQGGAQGPEQQDQLNGRDTSIPLQTMPNRLDSMKWILVGGFVALFALGLVFIWRRPIAIISDGGASAAAMASLPAQQGPRGPRKQAALRQARRPTPAPTAPSASSTPAHTGHGSRGRGSRSQSRHA